MIAVTGATGNIGRTLVTALAAAGEKVVAISRGTTDIRLPDGIEHRAADLGDLDTLSTALTGADTLFLLITGAQLVSGPEPDQVLATAAAAGVGKVVFLSSQGAATRPGSAAYARTLAFENALARTDLEWTVLRPSGFFSNTYAWIEPISTRRIVPAPFGNVGLPVVDPADVAAVAAAALTEPGHAGATYTLTGPAVITPRRQTAALAAALGVPLHFQELTRAEARTGMLRFMPEAIADHTLTILGEPTPEELRVSNDIPRVLGRPATEYATWATHNAPAYR